MFALPVEGRLGELVGLPALREWVIAGVPHPLSERSGHLGHEAVAEPFPIEGGG